MDKAIKNFFKWLDEKELDDICLGGMSFEDEDDDGYYADDNSCDGYEEDPDSDIDWDWYEQFYEDDEDEDSGLPDFISGRSSNVYRTKYYIVKQVISYANDKVFGTYLTSHDTFYLRTRERDEQFNELFRGNFYPDGRRIPTMAYDRIYVK